MRYPTASLWLRSEFKMGVSLSRIRDSTSYISPLKPLRGSNGLSFKGQEERGSSIVKTLEATNAFVCAAPPPS